MTASSAPATGSTSLDRPAWGKALLRATDGVSSSGTARIELSSKRLVRERNVVERVIFRGARRDLLNVLTALDVLALPSTFEGFGIVQAEAMYLGSPVVATNHGGSTEVVEDGVTGFLVPFGDVDALVDRLRRLWTIRPFEPAWETPVGDGC